MTCRVLLFAQAADAVGASAVTLTLHDDATVADALDELAAQHPGLVPLRSMLAVAVNEQYARPGDALHDDDVLAIIPPVSGG